MRKALNMGAEEPEFGCMDSPGEPGILVVEDAYKEVVVGART